MIITITLILVSLVALNFLLLAFSCNKTKKASKDIKMPYVLKPSITIEEAPIQLAPTGS